MSHHARARSASVSAIFTLGVGLALAACGGKGTGAAGPRRSGKVPFDQEAVKAVMAATPVDKTQSCGIEGAATVGDAMRLHKAEMDGDGGARESFSCEPSGLADGQWQCTWEVVEKTTIANPDDPCAGGGSAFQAIGQVNADGVPMPGQLACIAPG